MIDWSINKLKTTINVFVNNEFDLNVDRLLIIDWSILMQMRDFLKFFYEITKFIENKNIIINKIFFMLDFLLHKFETKTLKHASNSLMILSIDSSFKKLQKYWNIIIVQNFIYIVVIILNFRHKWNYFQHWNRDVFQQIKISLNVFWQKYNHVFATINEKSINTTKINANIIIFEFFQWMHKNQSMKTSIDELTQYTKKFSINVSKNIIVYWKS